MPTLESHLTCPQALYLASAYPCESLTTSTMTSCSQEVLDASHLPFLLLCEFLMPLSESHPLRVIKCSSFSRRQPSSSPGHISHTTHFFDPCSSKTQRLQLNQALYYSKHTLNTKPPRKAPQSTIKLSKWAAATSTQLLPSLASSLWSPLCSTCSLSVSARSA